jgi:ubiquinone/menaquinone biosynthesis C-methylase UbiE
MKRLAKMWPARLRRLVLSPSVYDFVQRLAGDRQLQRRLRACLDRLPGGSRVVDFGGGTGLVKASATGHRYVCLDLDPHKLRSFRAKHGDGLAILGNAIRCPIRTASSHAVVCTRMTHHLSDADLQSLLAEADRVTKPGGVLILADAVRSKRLVSRLLWRIDRGSYPRTADAIRRALPPAYVVITQERFRLAIFHDFLLFVASRRLEATPGDAGGGGGDLSPRPTRS